MATYTIIGGDQKEYGPVTADEVRQWIAESRLSEKSLVKAESDAEFRALEKFPEFADVFAPKAPAPGVPPPAFAPAENQDQTALKMVKSPAVALKITAILNLVFGVWDLLKLIFFPAKPGQIPGLEQINDPQLQAQLENIFRITNGPIGIISVVVALAISFLIFIGASKMQALRSYEFAFIAAILAMIPCLTPCCLIGLPFGIWALVILCRKEVKSQFK
jgi:hypothetical protein